MIQTRPLFQTRNVLRQVELHGELERWLGVYIDRDGIHVQALVLWDLDPWNNGYEQYAGYWLLRDEEDAWGGTKIGQFEAADVVPACAYILDTHRQG